MRRIKLIFMLAVAIPLNLLSYSIFKLFHPEIARDWYPDGFIGYLKIIGQAVQVDWEGAGL